MANWSKAAQVLGMGLMQYGVSMKDREQRDRQMANDALRNERLDALAERRVVNEEAMTASNVRKSDLEAIKMGIENEHLSDRLKAEIRHRVAQGDLAGAQALLTKVRTTGEDIDNQTRGEMNALGVVQAGANVESTVLGNEAQRTENTLNDQFSGSERALALAQAGANVESTVLNNKAQQIKNKLLDRYGETQMGLEIQQLYWGNKKTRADIDKGESDTLLKERELKLKEFISGLEYDEKEGGYKIHDTPLPTKSEKLPTAALQLAGQYLPGFEEQAFNEALTIAQGEGKITADMTDVQVMSVLRTGKDKRGIPYMPSSQELMFQAVDYAVQQMGRANYGAMQFQAVQEGVQDEGATSGLMRSPYQRESIFK